MSGTQIVDARHRDSVQTPSFVRGGPVGLHFSLVPVSGCVLVQPLQYIDAPPWILSTIQTQAVLVQGTNPPQFVDARHREALGTPPPWLRSAALVPQAAPPSRGNQITVGPWPDVDEAYALTIAGLIDQRSPLRNEVIVPPQEEFVPPSFRFNFSGTGIVSTTTPPLGAQLFTQPVWEDTPFSWVWNFNGTPFVPYVRLSAGATLVVPPIYLRDEVPFTWNWNGVPVIPGQRPTSSYQLIVQPQEEHLPYIFTSPGYGPYVPPPPIPPGFVIMPNVVGLNYYEAQQVLAAVGVFIPPGYFELSTISILWMDFGPYSTDVDEMGGENQLTYGGIVTAQSLAAGTLVKRGAPITLTVSNFPMSGLIQ